VFPLLWFYVVEKVAAVFRFLSNKIKLPHKREKKKKKNTRHKTKKFQQPRQIFLVVWQFFTHSHTVERNPPRLNLNREFASVSTA